MNHTIAPATMPDDIPEVRAIFKEYMQSLDIDLSFQGADAELAELPGKYAAPEGQILLARDASGTLTGCLAFRPLAMTGACEFKRLYIRPEARGTGTAKALIAAAIANAKGIGYTNVYLDTLASMQAARRLYVHFGFAEIAPYYLTPIRETVFMRLSMG